MFTSYKTPGEWTDEPATLGRIYSRRNQGNHFSNETPWSTRAKRISCFFFPKKLANCLGILNHNYPLDNVNKTFITLIPKVKDAKRVSDFGPISLYNVIYKIVVKVLAKMLKTILPAVISPTQTAFVPGRLISDNTLVAYEVLLHSISSRFKGKVRYMALKLDMSKAYDRIEWVFPEAILTKMGFHANWIKFIMNFVSSVSYSILVNGNFNLGLTLLKASDKEIPYL